MKRKKPNVKDLTDSSVVGLYELAAYMRMGVTTIWQDTQDGYAYEFPTKRRTTPGHYKAWLRARGAELKTTAPADQERQERELRHLRSASGTAHARRKSRGSRTSSPAKA